MSSTDATPASPPASGWNKLMHNAAESISAAYSGHNAPDIVRRSRGEDFYLFGRKQVVNAAVGVAVTAIGAAKLLTGLARKMTNEPSPEIDRQVDAGVVAMASGVRTFLVAGVSLSDPFVALYYKASGANLDKVTGTPGRGGVESVADLRSPLEVKADKFCKLIDSMEQRDRKAVWDFFPKTPYASNVFNNDYTIKDPATLGRYVLGIKPNMDNPFDEFLRDLRGKLTPEHPLNKQQGQAPSQATLAIVPQAEELCRFMDSLTTLQRDAMRAATPYVLTKKNLNNDGTVIDPAKLALAIIINSGRDENPFDTYMAELRSKLDANHPLNKQTDLTPIAPDPRAAQFCRSLASLNSIEREQTRAANPLILHSDNLNNDGTVINSAKLAKDVSAVYSYAADPFGKFLEELSDKLPARHPLKMQQGLESPAPAPTSNSTPSPQIYAAGRSAEPSVAATASAGRRGSLPS